MGKQMLKRVLKTVLYLVIIVSALFLLMRMMPRETYWEEKPVIYLYPEETTAVSVRLDYDGQLTCT